MSPSRNTSRTRCQFGPIPRVVGYNAALRIEDPEAYTRLDLPLADRHDIVPSTAPLSPSVLPPLLPFKLVLNIISSGEKLTPLYH